MLDILREAKVFSNAPKCLGIAESIDEEEKLPSFFFPQRSISSIKSRQYMKSISWLYCVITLYTYAIKFTVCIHLLEFNLYHHSYFTFSIKSRLHCLKICCHLPVEEESHIRINSMYRSIYAYRQI